MLKSYKYRIYPNKEQTAKIEQTFGICRLVYNLGLETKIRAWEAAQINISGYDLMLQITDLKKAYKWMAEVDSQALNDTMNRLDNSYKNFFRGNGFPKFKNKHGRQSFRCPHNTRKVDFNNKTISIPKISNIKASITKSFQGQIKSITVSKTSTRKYFASILVDDKKEMPPKFNLDPERTVGIDLGIKSFVVTSDGAYYEPNRRLKDSLTRLKCLQRRASRKTKGSQKRKKANLCVAKLHEKIRNRRVDYCHKVTTELIRDNQTDTFVIEDLAVDNMLKNRKLAQAISDVGFGEFMRQMRYKCDWYGKNLIQIGRFDPSSKMCSECGSINERLTLADREWVCANCGSIHDRDLNAAKNIRRIGLEKYSRPGRPGGPVESRRIRRAKKQEFCIQKT